MMIRRYLWTITAVLFPSLGISLFCSADVFAQKTTAAPIDLTGIWMPTAIGPDGERNRTWPEKPPFLPEVQVEYDAYSALMESNAKEFDAARSCLPYVMPRPMLVTAQYPLDFIQTDTQLTIVFELHSDVRRIFLDGREPPSGLLPTWMGYSTGRWDGESLVVTTTAVRDATMPRPHGPQAAITERFRLIADREGKQMLENEITISDAEHYVEPITVKNYFRQHEGLEMGEYFCSEDLWRQNLSGVDSEIPWRNN